MKSPYEMDGGTGCVDEKLGLLFVITVGGGARVEVEKPAIQRTLGNEASYLYLPETFGVRPRKSQLWLSDQSTRRALVESYKDQLQEADKVVFVIHKAEAVLITAVIGLAETVSSVVPPERIAIAVNDKDTLNRPIRVLVDELNGVTRFRVISLLDARQLRNQ